MAENSLIVEVLIFIHGGIAYYVLENCLRNITASRLGNGKNPVVLWEIVLLTAIDIPDDILTKMHFGTTVPPILWFAGYCKQQGTLNKVAVCFKILIVTIT